MSFYLELEIMRRIHKMKKYTEMRQRLETKGYRPVCGRITKENNTFVFEEDFKNEDGQTVKIK